jgi:hypothetical protein|tara:strand:+ start:262 stop:597 length:336 start_codon:yes stop_codon:yes gene_type:complete
MAVTTGRARRRLRIVVVVIIAATTVTAIFVHIEPSLPAGSCVLIDVDIAIFPTQDNIIPIILPAGRIYTIYLVTYTNTDVLATHPVIFTCTVPIGAYFLEFFVDALLICDN